MSRPQLEEIAVLATSRPAAALERLGQVEPDVSPADEWLFSLAKGLAFRSQFGLESAERFFNDALEQLARDEQSGASETERILISRAGNFALRGAIGAALADLDAAGESPFVVHQRAAVLAMAGRIAEALNAQSQALNSFREAGEPLWTARALQNRSKIGVLTGLVDSSIQDASEAVDTYEAMGHAAGAAKSRHNLASLLALKGDISASLALFKEADAELVALGIPTDPGTEARVEALMIGGLFAEALELAETVTVRARHQGAGQLEAECTLLAARAAAALGQDQRAASLAARAVLLFNSQGREGFALLARLLHAQCDETENDHRGLVADLQGNGWHNRAFEFEASAITRAFLACRKLPSKTLPAGSRKTPEADLLQAIESFELSDFSGAIEACGRAARSIEIRPTSGYDLRVASRAQLGSVIAVAVRSAISHGHTAAVWDWTERAANWADSLPVTASSMSIPAALRLVNAELERAVAKGDLTAVAGLTEHLSSVKVPGEQLQYRGRETVSLADFQAIVGNRVAWKLCRHGAKLALLVVTDSKAELVEFDWSELSRRARQLHAELLRAVTTSTTRTSTTKTGWQDRISRAQTKFGEMFSSALGDWDQTSPVVLLADAPISQWPWALMPQFGNRALTVCNSGSLWSEQKARQLEHRRPPTSKKVNLIVGPGLGSAFAEASDVQKIWGTNAAIHTTMSRGSLRGVFAESEIVHLAAHGRSRAENPDFSSLELSPLPVTIREIEGFASMPPLIVLGSCELGSSAEGHRSIAERLNRAGASTVIAPTIAINDSATRPVMVQLHAHLSDGAAPEEALRRTRQGFSDPSTVEWLHARAFQCFGCQ